jgi:hypothetical protein
MFDVGITNITPALLEVVCVRGDPIIMWRMRVTAAAVPAGAAAAASRRTLWFTQQSANLQSLKDQRGYKSDMWVSVEDDQWWYGKHSTLKAGHAPATSVTLPKRLELINVSQLSQPIEGLDEPPVHSSLSTSKPYKGQMLKELEERALISDYTSKWWMTPNNMRTRGAQLAPRMRAHVVLMKVPANVINVDEFADPAAIAAVPVNGETARPAFGEVAATLTAATQAHSYTHNVYYLEGILAELKLAPKKKAKTVSTTSGDINTFYNLEDFEDRAALADIIPADYVADPSKPRYLTTGTLIQSPHTLEAMKGSSYAESLWMSLKDLQYKQVKSEKFRLKPGAQGISLPAFVATWYNVEELSDPKAALKAVGSFTR